MGWASARHITSRNYKLFRSLHEQVRGLSDARLRRHDFGLLTLPDGAAVDDLWDGHRPGTLRQETTSSSDLFTNKFGVFRMLVYGAMISAFSLFPMALPWTIYGMGIGQAHYVMALLCMVQ